MPVDRPTAAQLILRVAVPGPLRRCFDYCWPATGGEPPVPGIRVQVPFGRRQLVGVLVEVASSSDLPLEQLRPATALLDDEPVLPPATMALLKWAADYYHHPLGDALAQALPVLLRQGEPAKASRLAWRLTSAGLALPAGALRRSPTQQAAFELLLKEGAIAAAELPAHGLKPEHLRALAAKGLAERFEQPAASRAPIAVGGEPSLPPSAEQRAAIEAVAADLGRYACHLLEGVTGSGKTEVYLQLIERVLARGEQVLVLVPEIGLTPQTLARFRRRLATSVAVLHSGLTDSERLEAWRQARSGAAGVVLGTRSAIFVELARPGLIIVDEEHDASYKQQDGFRYHARDLAIKRAADAAIPILLGSATPALESLHNALSGRYRLHHLSARPGAAPLPPIEVVDIRRAPMREGLSPLALEAISATLARGEQALVFLNRRGFAPTLLCHDCGWIAGCDHCDARLTVHYGARRLVCHHCGHVEALETRCPACRSGRLEFRGPGTERLEQLLAANFPQVPVHRIDRDTTSRKQAMATMVEAIGRGEPCLLVGTQMLAKGHHFPGVTLVVMVDADGGLFSADFRGPEKLGQLLTQVAGRAGRAAPGKPGAESRVLLQTHYPDHPLLQQLVRDGYGGFARALLDERRVQGLPPFGFLALVRADARSAADADRLLLALRKQVPAGITALGPLPAPLSRRAGLHRAQLLLQSLRRPALHRALQALEQQAEQHPLGQRVRWSIDVDPVDMG
jgi:primosomal protein N' (replication factor Y)